MADEVKNGTPPVEDNVSPKSGEDVKGESNSKHVEADTADNPKKTRGIGFLGRRGTAPIRTTANAGDKPKEDEENSADKGEDKPAEQKTLPIGFADKIFINTSKFPALALLFLLFVFVLQNLLSIWLPSIYFAQELSVVEVYADMQGMGQWLIPPATEHMEASFPVFFWFMALLDLLPLSDAIFLPLVAVATALIVLFSTYTLGLCAGLGRGSSFACALILLSCPYFIGLSHFVSPELFTAGLFTLALALLAKAWLSESAPLSFILGFLFVTLATLSGGFLPLWTILISSIFFIIWRCTFARAHQLDAVLGFAMLIVSFTLWLIAIIIIGGPEASALDGLMQEMLSPFVPPLWPLKDAWFCGFMLMALGLVPWILVPLFASWIKIIKNSWTNIKASRKENAGIAWLYINFVVGSILLILSAKPLVAIILLPVLSVLLAKALCNLSSLGSRVFYGFIALCSFVCALLCLAMRFAPNSGIWADVLPKEALNVLQTAQGFEYFAVILLVLAIVLFKFTKRASAGGSLLVVCLFTFVLVQPFTAVFAPSLVKGIAKYHPLGAGQEVFSEHYFTEPITKEDDVTSVNAEEQAVTEEPPVTEEQPIIDEPEAPAEQLDQNTNL